MKPVKPLSGFFNATKTDGRICINHIGLYAVLLQIWEVQGCQNPVMAFSWEVMKRARISNRVTYLKYLKDLHDGGYILYQSSPSKNERSKIYLMFEC